jgi:ABC-type branched-subunit amino acid transport system ATPase component
LNVLQAEDVTAGYNRLPVIREINVHVEPGSIVSVIGPNGSGKSTLLKALVGRLKPMSGRVTISGADVTGWPTHKVVANGLGYVPQTNNVFVSLSVRENLEMGAFSKSGNIRAQVEKVLATFPDLAASPGKKAGVLSGGQRNLLGVARALMSDPKVILVDEPTAGLAPANARLIWEQLVRIAAQGAGVLVVEQNVDAALEHSQWCYVMVAGKCRLDGSVEDVRKENLHDIFLGLDQAKLS